MSHLRLNLLGRAEARLDSGESIDIPGAKAAGLLACLALAPDCSLTRAKLLHLLWSDRSESQARASLRQLLWALRKSFQTIDPTPLMVDEETVTLLSERVDIDAVEIRRLVESDLPEDLAAAAKLYRGDLLEDLVVRDAALEEHLFYERENLRKLALDALNRLLQFQADAMQTDDAFETAQKILSIDSLQEEAHRYLIRHYLHSGHTGLAIEQFKRCQETFRRELGVDPSEKTSRLLDEATAGRKDAGPGPEATPAKKVSVRERQRYRALFPVAGLIGAIVIGSGVLLWFEPWEAARVVSPTEFSVDTGGRGWGRQGVKAGRINIQLDLPTRWDARVVETESENLLGFETDKSKVQLAFIREQDGKTGPQAIVAKDREGIADFRVFKFSKYVQTAGSQELHDWLQNRGASRLLDRYVGSSVYEEKRGAIEKGTLGSGEELTLIPSVLRVNEGTQHTWIGYVIRKKSSLAEVIVFFFHNGERPERIELGLVLAVTESATKVFN